ncbi:MAG: metal ABC transporter ATP-binding protein, partial [Clostridioides difficile]|nr:metal ABC transporter ATP-binding protein [Clostridioides difficile]
FPITVKECVSLGTYQRVGLFRHLRKKEWGKVENVLRQVKLEEFSNHPISTLSGGQFQRMLIARCLIQEQDILFLDEPFVGIDLVSEQIIMNLLQSLRREGKTIVIVHHDLSKVSDYFDKVVILNKKLVGYGDVATTFTPDALKKAYGDSIVVL